jgi:hypothetical protein
MKLIVSRLSDLIPARAQLRSSLEEQAFALRATAFVSKDGGLHDRRPRRSFETHRLRDAPPAITAEPLRRDEVENVDLIRTSETQY